MRVCVGKRPKRAVGSVWKDCRAASRRVGLVRRGGVASGEVPTSDVDGLVCKCGGDSRQGGRRVAGAVRDTLGCVCPFLAEDRGKLVLGWVMEFVRWETDVSLVVGPYGERSGEE